MKNINMHFKKPGLQLGSKTIHVLRDVNLDIYPGEIVAVIGESGCGKTTLGRIITGLFKPTSGEIWFEGKKVSGFFDKKVIISIIMNTIFCSIIFNFFFIN